MVRDRLRLTTGYRRLAGRASLGFALNLSTSDQAIPLRQLHDLVKGLVHLPGSLRVNAIAPALLDAEVVVPRELIRPHQGEEIRFLARLEQLTRLGDVSVVTAKSHQQIASAHQRGAQSRRRYAAVSRRFDQHP